MAAYERAGAFESGLAYRQVGMALARPPLPRPPPLPQQRTATFPSLPLVDPEHVRLLEDDQKPSP